MFENILHTLREFVGFTDEDLSFFVSLLKARTLKKNEFFIQPGQRCTHISFVEKGAFKLYYLKDGKELINRFYLDYDWMSDYSAFLTRQVSGVYIEAQEDAQLFTISYENIQLLYERNKAFERLGRLKAEALYNMMVERYALFLSSSPEERYLKLLDERPQLLDRFPLKDIASYLGIQPESLSRIRKRLNPNQ